MIATHYKKFDSPSSEASHNRYYRQLFLNFLLISVVLLFLFNFSKFTTTSGPTSTPETVQPPPQQVETTTTAVASTKVWREYRNPVESLDGVGYKFADDGPFVPDPRYEGLNNLPACDLTKDKNPMDNNPTHIVQEFHKCIKPIVEQFRGKPNLMNVNWTVATVECDKLEIWKNLQILEFRNLHEIKWTILPKCKDTVNNMVTLGVGHDTEAEELLNRTLPNTNFYGADPMINPNLQLYSAFGKFFPFAIGKKGGMSRFRVLPDQNQKTRSYSYQDVTTIGFTYFLDEILGLKRVDIAWIDIEGGEFEFIDMIHRNGPLDQKNIAICQFNLEVHSKFHPPGEQIYYDFIFKILEEGRYVFLKPLITDVGVHRMFFINMENKECVRKFIQ